MTTDEDAQPISDVLEARATPRSYLPLLVVYVLLEVLVVVLAVKGSLSWAAAPIAALGWALASWSVVRLMRRAGQAPPRLRVTPVGVEVAGQGALAWPDVRAVRVLRGFVLWRWWVPVVAFVPGPGARLPQVRGVRESYRLSWRERCYGTRMVAYCGQLDRGVEEVLVAVRRCSDVPVEGGSSVSGR